MDTKTQTVTEELRAGAARARETFTPAAMARVLHRTHVAICGNHTKSPTLVCHGCAYFDTEDPVLARLLVALLNAREPLAAWLESWDGVELREDGPLPEDFKHALAVARALNGGERG